ncbi:MAG: hypothetical protein NDJ90_05845 [Oligoflexia bacterium]|nr:hypothetical protein [Oligoflexia bacterium]
MSTWIIISWVAVALLTIINIVVFLKLKDASEQMLKMAFPGAKNMNEAVAGMQKMMQGMGGKGGRGFPGGGGFPKGGLPKGPSGGASDAQLKAAMDMLQQMQKKGGKR